LKDLGFSHLCARTKARQQDPDATEAFKNALPAAWNDAHQARDGYPSRGLVSGRDARSGAHAILIPDQASWHGAKGLRIACNLSLVPLPPRAPGLNALENIWQFMRQN